MNTRPGAVLRARRHYRSRLGRRGRPWTKRATCVAVIAVALTSSACGGSAKPDIRVGEKTADDGVSAEVASYDLVANRAGRFLVGINNRDSRRFAISFLRETGVTYPSGFDPGGQIAAAYAVAGMPTTVFISADGTLLSKHTGQLRASTLRDDIARYFHINVLG